MGTMAAGIQAKVAGRALDGTGGHCGTAVGGQRPGAGYLGAAEGTVEAISTAEIQGAGAPSKQVLLLLVRHLLDARLPPVAVGEYGAHQHPAKSARSLQVTPAGVEPHPPSAIAQEAQQDQSNC